ncbi:hypothetical protein HPB48_011690 [Haemaphysalis longicornis]|uniref:Uncharacterized protein n=1 Tax=Haemaphysalis longicornis TaxID=44386 RepID=A0A9J6GQX7_HAELO|nr:hypothetical protein HPB48_011690 [Haemaphysalis longicornis]
MAPVYKTNTFPRPLAAAPHSTLPYTQADAHPAEDNPNLTTSTWECPNPRSQCLYPAPLPPDWEAALSSSALDDQRGLIDTGKTDRSSKWGPGLRAPPSES